MLLISATALAMMAAGPVPAPDSSVGYEPLVEGRDAAAIAELEANTELAVDDPVRLINLGIAYARQGRTEEARAMFEAAMWTEDRVALETATGEWKDSRHLARFALRMLDSGEFRGERMASR